MDKKYLIQLNDLSYLKIDNINNIYVNVKNINDATLVQKIFILNYYLLDGKLKNKLYPINVIYKKEK